MNLRELFEGATPTWGKTGGKLVRKYRCTSGKRKGRVVAKPSTCAAAIDMKRSTSFKKTRRSKSASMSINSRRTKRTHRVSKRLGRLNKRK